MINGFRESQVRDSAIIYKSTWEQIKKLYAKSPEQAGELAISAIELALTSEISSDDFMIELLLENMKVVNERNKVKFDKRTEANRQKKIADQKLDLIAELYAGGMKQKDIAVRIGITPQTISNRIALIRTDFPELLEKNQENQENQVNQANDNENENDNVNIGLDCANAQPNQGLPCANAQGRREQPNSEEEFKKAWGR